MEWKFQIPSTRFQTSTNILTGILETKSLNSNLEFGNYLDIGIWSLVIVSFQTTMLQLKNFFRRAESDTVSVI
jgi:hypothetical protein